MMLPPTFPGVAAFLEKQLDPQTDLIDRCSSSEPKTARLRDGRKDMRMLTQIKMDSVPVDITPCGGMRHEDHASRSAGRRPGGCPR